jgi:hypothetical protein
MIRDSARNRQHHADLYLQQPHTEPCAHRMSRSHDQKGARARGRQPLLRLAGGRRRWAHVKFTRMNIALTILQKDIEDFLNVAVFSLLVEEFELRPSPVGRPRSLDVAADLAALPESLITPIEQQGSRGGMGHQIGVYRDSPARREGMADGETPVSVTCLILRAARPPGRPHAGVRQAVNTAYDGRGSCHSRTAISKPPMANRVTPPVATNMDTLGPAA